MLFPPELIALNKEVALHEDLQIKLASVFMDNLAEKLAVICTHCGYLVDGHYTEAESTDLILRLIDKLRAMRTIHVDTTAITHTDKGNENG